MQSNPVSTVPADLLPLVEDDEQVEYLVRGRILGRFLPRWFRTLLGTKLSLIGFTMFVIIVACAIFAPLLTHYSPTEMNPLSIGLSPSWAHPFGTNDAGQDIYSQTLYGGRFTLAVGITAGIAVTVLAVVIGMIAGYLGGWVDDALSMVMNVFLILPQLPLLIVISAYVGLRGDQPVATALLMAAVITITGWAWGGRVMRAQTLSLRSRDFVDAAKVNGEGTTHIVFRDMMPNMLALIVNTVILSTMGAIVTESTLDVLGVGSMSQVTWGTILFNAISQSTLFTHEWWCFVFPGMAIVATVMSMILMNNGVDALANPRLRRIKPPKRARKQTAQPETNAGFVVEAAS